MKALAILLALLFVCALCVFALAFEDFRAGRVANRGWVALFALVCAIALGLVLYQLTGDPVIVSHESN